MSADIQFSAVVFYAITMLAHGTFYAIGTDWYLTAIPKTNTMKGVNFTDKAHIDIEGFPVNSKVQTIPMLILAIYEIIIIGHMMICVLRARDYVPCDDDTRFKKSLIERNGRPVMKLSLPLHFYNTVSYTTVFTLIYDMKAVVTGILANSFCFIGAFLGDVGWYTITAWTFGGVLKLIQSILHTSKGRSANVARVSLGDLVVFMLGTLTWTFSAAFYGHTAAYILSFRYIEEDLAPTLPPPVQSSGIISVWERSLSDVIFNAMNLTLDQTVADTTRIPLAMDVQSSIRTVVYAYYSLTVFVGIPLSIWIGMGLGYGWHGLVLSIFTTSVFTMIDHPWTGSSIDGFMAFVIAVSSFVILIKLVNFAALWCVTLTLGKSGSAPDKDSFFRLRQFTAYFIPKWCKIINEHKEYTVTKTTTLDDDWSTKLIDESYRVYTDKETYTDTVMSAIVEDDDETIVYGV